jgi:uncharacterized membrane protein
MPSISKAAGSSYTVSGSLKNTGTIDLNIWTACVLKGPSSYGYAVAAKIAIAVGATTAFTTRTHMIPADAPAGDYKLYIAVGDDTTAFQEADTGWTITVTAPIKMVQCVNVTVT